MKIYLADQKNNFKKHLEILKATDVMEYEKSLLPCKTTTIDIQTTKKINELNLDFLFNYRVFPGNIMSFATQWIFENRKMRVGDTIVQQVYIPPAKILSQKIVLVCE